MIKRRFYKLDRGDQDSDSSSSSQSSDEEEEKEEEDQQEAGGSEGEEEKEDEEEEGEDEKVGHGRGEEAKWINRIRDGSRSGSPFASSGYESEDSSGNEITCDESAGLLFNDDEVDARIEKQKVGGKQLPLKEGKEQKQPKPDVTPHGTSESDHANLDEWVLKYKSVFKCRLCPRIVCLSEASMETHLKSKRHARSKKLLREGRLKLMLNSDGELQEDEETHAERHARTVALAQQIAQSKVAIKKNKGRQRQSQRRKVMQESSAKNDKRGKGPLSKIQAKKRKVNN